MRDCSKLKFGVVWVLFCFILLICMLPYWTGVGYRENGSKAIISERNYKLSSVHRKLLSRSLLAMEKPDRAWGEKCTRGDILINQGPSEPLPSGIPVFTVEIMNRCGSGCNISGIHLSCGWFSSDHLINPKIFKRLRYNDCLVNDGKPLVNGGTLTFIYANTFPYPLAVSSIMCS